jgi:hypothetical protein
MHPKKLQIILYYIVLLCIEFVILLIEEKVMSYVTVSEGHGHPLVILYYSILYYIKIFSFGILPP